MNTVTTSLHQTLPLQLTPTNTWQTVDLLGMYQEVPLSLGAQICLSQQLRMQKLTLYQQGCDAPVIKRSDTFYAPLDGFLSIEKIQTRNTKVLQDDKLRVTPSITLRGQFIIPTSSTHIFAGSLTKSNACRISALKPFSGEKR
jgi:hypothetical protein